MGEAAGAAAAVMGSRCSWELRRRGVGGGDAERAVPGLPDSDRDREPRRQLRARPPRSPPRENGCGADRAAKFAPEERAAGGRTGGAGPPTPLRVLGGDPRLSGLYKKLRRAREEAAAAAVRLAPLPHPVRPPPRPAPPPAGSPPRSFAAAGRRLCPPGEGALLLPDMVQSGGRRAMAP